MNLKGLFGSIVGITKHIPGPVGWASSAVNRFTQGPRSQPQGGFRPNLPQATTRTTVGPGGIFGTRTTSTPVQTLNPVQSRGGGGTAVQKFTPKGDACPAGYRLNKTSYHLKDGTYVEEGTVCVKIRRRNPANPKALRAAMRREEGFVRLAKRALKGTKYKVSTVGSGGKKVPQVIVESGRGSVVTR